MRIAGAPGPSQLGIGDSSNPTPLIHPSHLERVRNPHPWRACGEITRVAGDEYPAGGFGGRLNDGVGQFDPAAPAQQECPFRHIGTEGQGIEIQQESTRIRLIGSG